MAAERADGSRQLPSGYTSIQDILAQETPATRVGCLINVIGLVKDFQVPIPTNKKDYKSAITIFDKSMEHSLGDITINIFRPREKMPEPTAGDVLVTRMAKIQSYRDNISLLSNTSTSFHIYTGSDIPRPPQSAKVALRYSDSKIGEKEHEYASWLYHQTSKDSVPDAYTFQQRADQSAHTKAKFCKLEDVVENKFCDVIVNVVKAPFDYADKTTLWVSDYTEHDSFHKFIWDGGNAIAGRDGDPYGYLDSRSNWAGPYGKRSIQVTCFGYHASLVKEKVQLGDWIRLRNLRIKLGSNHLNLEGVLHEDPDYHRQQFDILKWDEGGSCDPRLKEAIRRKKEYEKLRKAQRKEYAEDEGGAGPGTKRKASNSEEPRITSKTRRKEKREAAFQKVAEQDKRAEERLGLNDLIKCESQQQPITPVPSIIEPVPWKTTVEGEETTLTLPFACAMYRANVRVVNFRPAKLEKFAVWRQSTESDVLSDWSSGSDSDSDDDLHGTLGRYEGVKIWEWRFALLLEDANPKPKGPKDRFWAVVDNIEAQLLTGLDACDLRASPDTLDTLRERMFTLWGNLEEIKRQEQQRLTANRRRVATKQPPPSSPAGNDDGDGNGDDEHRPRGPDGAENTGQKAAELSNKPFACCIRQYGARVEEPDPNRADAGEGYRWVRMFGLFGTKISA